MKTIPAETGAPLSPLDTPPLPTRTDVEGAPPLYETLAERETRLRTELRTGVDTWRQRAIYDELERIGFARGGAW